MSNRRIGLVAALALTMFLCLGESASAACDCDCNGGETTTIAGEILSSSKLPAGPIVVEVTWYDGASKDSCLSCCSTTVMIDVRGNVYGQTQQPATVGGIYDDDVHDNPDLYMEISYEGETILPLSPVGGMPRATSSNSIAGDLFTGPGRVAVVDVGDITSGWIDIQSEPGAASLRMGHDFSPSAKIPTAGDIAFVSTTDSSSMYVGSGPSVIWPHVNAAEAVLDITYRSSGPDSADVTMSADVDGPQIALTKTDGVSFDTTLIYHSGINVLGEGSGSAQYGLDGLEITDTAGIGIVNIGYVSSFAGNVGIGVSSPAEPLQVNGIIHSTSGGFKFPDGTIQLTAGGGGGSCWECPANYTYLFDSNDSVGIGTETPQEKLHVNGSILVEGKAALGRQLTYTGSDVFVAGYDNSATGALSAVGGGSNCVASGQHSKVGGGANNTASGFWSIVGGGADNHAAAPQAFVGGGAYDTAQGLYAAIGGGHSNLAGDHSSDTAAVVAGGHDNTAAAKFTSVLGGYSNQASGQWATVGGGDNNSSSADHTFVGGGHNNEASEEYATVGGGLACVASGFNATVSGGQDNDAIGQWATISGGTSNYAASLGTYVGGGFQDSATGQYATISGGYNNAASGPRSVVSGGGENHAGGSGTVVAGGEYGTTLALYGSVGGGYYNLAGDDLSDTAAVVSGGYQNRATARYTTIGGGRENEATNGKATVGGGNLNIASGFISTVGGGWSNEATQHGATVAGGDNNTASGNRSSIAGGLGNTASGWTTAISGGTDNTAAGSYSAIPGGNLNDIRSTADYSLAFGNEVCIDSAYRVIFFDSANPGRLGINRDCSFGVWYPVHVGVTGADGNGAYLTSGGTWTNGSSRSFKENFESLNGREVLRKIMKLPSEAWEYKETGERHIWPCAEEFHAQFDVGAITPDGIRDEKYLAGADVAGVALIGVQELYRMVQELQTQSATIAQLRDELAAMQDTQARLAQLEAAMEMLLAQQQNEDPQETLAAGK